MKCLENLTFRAVVILWYAATRKRARNLIHGFFVNRHDWGFIMLKRLLGAMGLAIAMQTAMSQESPMTPLRPDQVAFLALYKELVETNTTLSAGSCTVAAARIAVHLKEAGYSDEDITLFSVPEHPREGGLVAILAGTSKTAKPMLLLGHLDVVEAKREGVSGQEFQGV
jgi:hypothetical protein